MDPNPTTSRELRPRNRSAMLSKLFFDGPLSRVELGPVTGLSNATASNLVAELMVERLVVETGQVGSRGGRPRVQLRLNPAFGYLVGVDIGATGATVELFDLALERRATARRRWASARPRAETVAREVAVGVLEVTGDLRPSRVMGVGVSVPGMVEPGDPALLHAPEFGWRSVPFAKLLADQGVKPAVFMAGRAHSQAQAELWYGAAKGARHAVVVQIDMTCSASSIVDGQPYQGAGGSAGSWGHTTLVYGGRPCRCGANGCVEAYLGAGGILARFVESGGKLTATDPRLAVVELIATGQRSKVAAAVLAETAQLLGTALGNLINFVNPERLVVGGWAGLALCADRLAEIEAAAKVQALSQPFQLCTVLASTLEADRGALGAATLPMAAFLDRGEDIRSRRP